MRDWLFALALSAWSAAALSQPAPPSPPPDLYQDALQSIAEGRKSDASDALSRVIAEEPLHAGAWLDLALIQCALGNRDVAERLFRGIEERFAPPPGIIELISAARAGGCNQWRPGSAATLTAARGIDQNVNQGVVGKGPALFNSGLPADFELSPEFLPQHDQYSLVGGDYLRDLSPNGSIGFAQFQLRRYDSLSQYDSASVFAGVETPWRLRNWTVRSTAMLGLTTLGGTLYQRHAQLQARIGAPLALPGKTQLHVIAGVAHADYLTLESFDSNTVELKAQLSYRGNNRSATLTSGYLVDHATGDRAGGNRRGWQTSLQGRMAFDNRITGDLGYMYQSWFSRTPYAPGVIDITREQRLHMVRAMLTYPIAKHLNMMVEARQVWNRENIWVFQYNNRLLQVSLQWAL